MREINIHMQIKKPLQVIVLQGFGALDWSRTSTPKMGTDPSSQRVYQFRHQGRGCFQRLQI